MIKRIDCHSHTRYSNLRLRDALATPKQLIDRALELHLSAIAITDHESVSAHIKANKYAQEIKSSNPDFKVILGNEIYLVDERSSQEHYHFILLAKNAKGHKQLRKLSSLAWLNSYSTKGMTRVDTLKSDLERIVRQEPGNLIATTACIGGELGKSILSMEMARNVFDADTARKEHDRIVNFLIWCKNLFKEDFYLEVQPGISNEQIIVNKKIKDLSPLFDIKVIASCDTHYLKKEDRYVHKAFLNSENKEREVDAFYQDTYLHSNEEMIEKFKLSDYSEEYVNELFNNSMEIYNKIEDYSLLHTPVIPEVEVDYYPKTQPGDKILKYKTLSSMYQSNNVVNRYWVNTCVKKLKEIGKYNDTYLDELEEEAEVKTIVGNKLNTNMFQYPITFAHYIDLIWNCGSTIGVGRGSACSALNHYLLGITQLDPIEWNFPFFRYMNRDTDSLGDIDIDVCSSKVQKILQEIRDERGKDFIEGLSDIERKSLGAVYVCTFGTETSKSAILTACFEKDTKVKTLEGEKNIQDITSKDYVFTTNGWEKVIAPTELYWNEDYVEIDGNYGFEDKIISTNNHEFLILPKTNSHKLDGNINNKVINKLIPNYKTFSDNKKSKYRNYIRDIEPKWIQAKDLKEKDYLLSRIDDKIEDISFIDWKTTANKYSNFIKSHILIDNDFCELLGIWLAEGSLNRNMFSFTISSEERELKDRIIFLMGKVFELYNPYINQRKNNSILIQYSSADLRDFICSLFQIKNYNEINQYNKFIPNRLKYIEPSKQLQIFKGWIIGDGTYRQRINQEWQGSKEIKGTTVSRQLCLDMKHILHRNYLNPSIIREKRKDKAEVYNLTLSGKVAEKIGNIKYTNYEKMLIIDWDDRLGKDLPCVYENNLYMRYQIKTKRVISNSDKRKVYCLMVPSQNFTVSDIIVHNCRGYRTEDYPDGIDVDTAQYLSSLIPVERGFVWSISDTYNGNPDKNRKPVKPFIAEIDQYPGLLDIVLGIEGNISRRGRHASGVILMGKDPYEFNAFMKTPSGEIVTQYDLHDAEEAGSQKIDLLVTEVQDKIAQTIKFLQRDGIINNKLSLREAYNEILHPDILPLDNKDTWKVIQNAASLDLFQLDSDIGRQGAKKVKPCNMIELSSVNGLIRLMTQDKGAESWIDRYVRYKNNIDAFEKDIEQYGLSKEEKEALNKYLKDTYGIGISQEQLMKVLMDKNICEYSLKEANAARKIVSKKQMSKIPEFKEKVFKTAKSDGLAHYVWDFVVSVGLGYSFSDIHSLSYSFIGFQTAYLATNWNPIYWNTSCLIVNSGSLEEDEEYEIGEDDEPVKKKEKGTDYAGWSKIYNYYKIKIK